MKHIFAVLTMLFVLSCATTQEGASVGYDFENEIPDVSTPDQARNWVIYHIKYEEDPDNIWQLPEETVDKGTGDCEDMALLIAYIIYTHLDVEVILLSSMNHIWILIEDRLLDSVSRYTWIGASDAHAKTYTYREAIQKAIDNQPAF
jgi:hypothetical protein